ncbi:MAG TPA: bifunctional lytic transglycosylase/C40 family peptidase [Streptosporangiaceae bacterium]|jgi:cell wall-associated NlpC family hydrolase
MRRRVLLVVAIAAAGVLFAGLLVVPIFFGAGQFLFGGGAGSGACTDTNGANVQPAAATDAKSIPVNYLELYKKAGAKYGMPWNVVAGVGKVETDHGQSTAPGVHSGENFAGAGGPMQFLAGTWASFAVDGNSDGKKDRYDPVDAIPSAAAYLKHNGAPDRMRTAIFQYNHSWDYVDLVLAWAKRYASGAFNVVQAGGAICADNALLDGISDAVIAKIIAFAMAQRGKKYIFGATGPDAWDCSSLVQAAYRQVGVQIPRTTFGQWPFGVRVPKGKEKPGDLVFFYSGPNSGPDHPGHVGMVIGGGKMVVARCSACQPNIGVQNYTVRGDLAGFTRPLARPDVQKQLKNPSQ